ncbi:MAG: hypothetical protein ACREJR_12020, partial [Candidatus Rokuibacteriota bacterium]
YARWHVPLGSTVLVALTAWETPERAGDFARAYARLVVAKHGLAFVPNGPGLTWRAGPRAFLVEGRERAVLLVEGAPSDRLDALRAAVWARPVLY